MNPFYYDTYIEKTAMKVKSALLLMTSMFESGDLFLRFGTVHKLSGRKDKPVRPKGNSFTPLTIAV